MAEINKTTGVILGTATLLLIIFLLPVSKKINLAGVADIELEIRSMIELN